MLAALSTGKGGKCQLPVSGAFYFEPVSPRWTRVCLRTSSLGFGLYFSFSCLSFS